MELPLNFEMQHFLRSIRWWRRSFDRSVKEVWYSTLPRLTRWSLCKI